VSTLAGSGGATWQNGGYSDGVGDQARFCSPLGLTVDQHGNVYVADSRNHRIRKITPDGNVTTLAGTGMVGHIDGEGSAAGFSRFNTPTSVASDDIGNIYVAEAGNSVRKVLSNGDVFSVANTYFGWQSDLRGVAVDQNNILYVAASSTAVIYKITENGNVIAFAGSIDSHGYADGVGNEARFSSPAGLAVDQDGNVYVADSSNHRIRKITPDGNVTTLAGTGTAGFADGNGSEAQFNIPYGIAVDSSGNVYVADLSNNRIRKITANGKVTTIAGSGASGYADGNGAEARFSLPAAITLGPDGSLYVADDYNRIRKITIHPKITTSRPVPSARPDQPFEFTFGVTGATDLGTWSISKGTLPPGLSFNALTATLYGTPIAAGNFNFSIRVESGGYSDEMEVQFQVFSRIISLSGNLSFGAVRVTDAERRVLTISNTGSHELTVTGIAYPSGFSGNWSGKIPPNSSQNVSVFFAPTSASNYTGNITLNCDATSGTIALPCTGIGTAAPAINVTTLAGAGTPGHGDGQGTAAFFRQPTGVALDKNDNLYVADYGNHLIRKITPNGSVTTLAGGGGNYWTGAGADDGHGKEASFNGPIGLAVDGNGNVYVADEGNNLIRMITQNGDVTTLAGSGISGSADGQGVEASFSQPRGIAVDESGNVYVSEGHNYLIRKITPDGYVTTLAGRTEASGFVDEMGKTSAFDRPYGIAVDKWANVYVADWGYNRIQKITSNGSVTTLAGSNKYGALDGIGTEASFVGPMGVTVDNSGNVYVADSGNNQIRKINASGFVTTLAGSKSYGFTDGSGAWASFRTPAGVAIDKNGNLYVADQYNNRVRKISIGQ